MKNLFKVVRLFFHYYWSKIKSNLKPETQECKKWCGSGYCDDNGCSNRKRHIVKFEDVEVLFHAYGHTSESKGVVVQVMAKNTAEALDKARIEHPDCKFNHANI